MYKRIEYRFIFHLCAHCRREVYPGDELYDISEITGKTGFIHKDCLDAFTDFNKNLVFRYLTADGSLCNLLKTKLECIKYED